MSKAQEIRELFAAYVMPTYTRQIVMTRGKGTRVWDADGKVYLDFLAGISVQNVGHCHPHVVEAIQRQAAELVHVSNLYYTENQGRLAQKLSALALGGKCFFCNSGAEANEGLIKLARLWGHDSGRHEVVTMTNSFHGRTLATAAATGQTKIQKGFEPMPEGFVYADFNNLDSVRARIGPKTVAVLVEAVQGEGGVIPADPAFLAGVRALCDEHNLLMLCDEVQCGMGRTGKWFGWQHGGAQPDAMSLAKSLGSGYPIGAVVSNPRLADVFQPGRHASTFGGTPLACAAALATIEVIESEGLVEHAAKTGAAFAERLRSFVGRFEHVTAVRGCGLMLGLVLDQDAKPLQNALEEMGLLCLATAGNVIRMLPPLNVKDGEIEEALDMIEDCLAEWHGASAGPATSAAAPESVPAAAAPAEPASEAANAY